MRDPIPEDEHKSQIDTIDDYLFRVARPKKFGGEGGAEARSYRNFSATCRVLAQSGMHTEPEKMSAFDFLIALTTLAAQRKPKAGKKRHEGKRQSRKAGGKK
jgi:hypothetical protein